MLLLRATVLEASSLAVCFAILEGSIDWKEMLQLSFGCRVLALERRRALVQWSLTKGALHERCPPTKCISSASIEPKQYFRKALVSESRISHTQNRESAPARDGSASNRKLISRRKSALR